MKTPDKDTLNACIRLKKQEVHYDKFREWLQTLLDTANSELQSTDELKDIYRKQGEIGILVRLTHLFDNAEVIMAGALVARQKEEAAEELLK